MTDLQLKVIKKAVIIRINNGENIDNILSSYTKLSDEERTVIKSELIN